LRKPFAGIGLALLGTVMRVETKEPLVALTFDDGPDPACTPKLLKVLEQHGARATFFMLGEAAWRHREIVKSIADAGHAIGNHSWDHPSFPAISGRERRAQIRACAKAMAPYGSRLFRPPYGHQSMASRLDAFMLRQQVIMFDVATDDWCGGDAATLAEQLERRLRPGSVAVLHDRLFDASKPAYFGREAMIEAVGILLERIGSRYKFVTVPELLSRGKARKEFWRLQPEVQGLNSLLRRETLGRRYTQAEKDKWSQSLLNFFLEDGRRKQP
jgi:peptidoglycan/xylan/chitin deacetylase (PgdA/CDA1 family)